MIKKIIIGLFWTIGCIVLGVKLDRWRSPWYPGLKLGTDQAFHDKVHRDHNCEHASIHSINSNFDIYFIRNVDLDNPNPYFPAIHITVNNSHNAWLQVVRTDASNGLEYQCFIDAWPKGHEKYPFYTRGQDFYDNPIWTYGLFSRDLSFWVGRTYAVQVDDKHKTIECIGGISWGYRLPWWSLRPVMILPSALTQQDWQTDWSVFEEALPGYENIS